MTTGMTEPDGLILFFAFLFGLNIGSFLNVCIYRLPRGKSIVSPPSSCPRCSKRIAWRDNIPVLGYLFLRGRCRHCAASISPRYPAVEIATALLFLFVALRFPLDWRIVFPLYYGSVLLVVTLTDFDLKLIPDSLTLPGIVVGLIFHGWLGGAWLDSILGVLAGGGTLFLIAEIYLRLRKREGMGGGDVKLAAMMGAFLGWKVVFIVLFLSSFLGGLFGAALMLFQKKSGGAEIPFGVFLAPVGFLALFWGEAWIAWYIGAFVIPR